MVKGEVTRSLKIRFRAMDHTAQTVNLKADELLSQVLEHEVDHLNGILYLDHMASHEKLVKDDGRVEVSEESDDSLSEDPASNASSLPGRSATGIWLPEDDGRNTPATIKVR